MSSAIKFTLIFLFFSSTTLANVVLPKLISDGVVLQRDSENLVWGWADENESVSIKFNGRVIAKTSAKAGVWSIKLSPQVAGGPHKIDIIGKNTISVSDIYFGDVWLASGQSNMQTTMNRVKPKYPNEIEQANYPLIRYFTVPRTYNFNQPLADVSDGQWLNINKNTLGEFSAVAYFFAKKLHLKHQVPIGILNSNYGGSPAQAWMSEEALAEFPHYLATIKKFRQANYLENLIASDKQRNDDWYAKAHHEDQGLQAPLPWYDDNFPYHDWPLITLPAFWQDVGVDMENGVIWFKKSFQLSAEQANSAAQLYLGNIIDADTAYINGVKVGNTSYQYPPRRYSVANNILKAGTNVITVRVVSNIGKGGFVKQKPYALTIGEHNISLQGEWHYRVGASLPPLQGPKFSRFSQPLGFYNAMIAPLLKTQIKGVIWYQGESNTGRATEYVSLFPAMIRDWRKQFKQGNFPFLFVQLANYMKEQPQPVESGWAQTREAQRLALSEPNTAMAVALDIGEWNDIHPLDKKSVGDRLALAAEKLAYGNNDVVYSGPAINKATLINQQVVLSFEHIGSGLIFKGEQLHGFAIAGSDGKFVWAHAKVDNNQVVVWHPQVKTPVTVRYAWEDNPAKATLMNKEGLPASSFEIVVSE